MPHERLTVLKTYKLYIGGKFPRSESGRTMPAKKQSDGTHLAHYSHASRKDLRDAVVAARSAFAGWRKATPYLRGQILYRAAEMMEGRRQNFLDEIQALTNQPIEDISCEIDASVDRLVQFAGWSDKYAQIFSSVNPVASPHHNWTEPDPVGVVGVISPDEPSILSLVTMIASTIASGNSLVAITSETAPLPAITLAEVFATSDLPAGVVNILTGKRAELAPWLADHMDVNAIVDASGDNEITKTISRGASKNLKRISSRPVEDSEDWFGEPGSDPYRILDTVEFKTTWHPVGA